MQPLCGYRTVEKKPGLSPLSRVPGINGEGAGQVDRTEGGSDSRVVCVCCGHVAKCGFTSVDMKQLYLNKAEKVNLFILRGCHYVGQTGLKLSPASAS